ncbi:MAG: hypothetical protein ACRDA5_04125, partial [Clostridium sp.]
MMNELKELIASVEYTYSLTLNIDFLNNTSSKYEDIIENENDLSFDELLYVHYLIALCNDHLHNDEKAMQHFKLCLYYSIKLDNQTFMGKCYLYIAKFYFALNDLDKYYYCFTKAEYIFSEAKNYCDLSKLYSYAISYKVKLTAYSKEISPLISRTLNALTHFENEYSAQIFMILGSVHSIYLKDNYHSIDLYKKALNLATKYNSINLKIMINYYIAVGYINLNRNSEACIILENLLSDNTSL